MTSRRTRTDIAVEDTPPAGWTAGAFQIATTKGMETVDGLVRGAFGLDRRHPESDVGWVLTHVPTGYALMPRVGPLHIAVAIVARIESIDYNWDTMFPDTSRAMRERIQAIIDEVYQSADMDEVSIQLGGMPVVGLR